MRHASRTDDVQPEIVKALRAVGASVYYLKLPLDLLVAYKRPAEHMARTLLLEIKDDDGRLNQKQKEFWDSWPGEKHLVRSPREALAVVMGEDVLK